MILFSSIIKSFEADFLAQYAGRILPSHRKALEAMKICRTHLSPRMLASLMFPIRAGIATVHTANIMKASNGWNDNFRNRCLLSIF